MSSELDPLASARRLVALVESSDDAIVSKDLNSIITSWNRAAERMFGYTAEEAVGQSMQLVTPPERREEEPEVVRRISRGETVKHFETVRQRKDGTTLPVSVTVSPILDADGNVVGASNITRDITERKQIERERQRLATLTQEQAHVTEKLNAVGTVVAATFDRGRVVQTVTDTATELTGADLGAFFYNPAEEPDSVYVCDAAASAAGQSAVEQAVAPCAQESVAALAASLFSCDSILRVDDVETDPRHAGDRACFTIQGQLHVRSYLAVPVKSRNRRVVGILFLGHSQPGSFSDRHERIVEGIARWACVGLENAALYDEIQDASRMKDEFLAVLSHELRTPLNAILGYARLLRAGVISGDKADRAVETLERNASALTQIVEDVLDVSRIVSGKIRLNVQTVNLALVLSDAVDTVLQAAELKGVRIATTIDPRLGAVSGDPDRLQQVAWNLLSNAVKFTPAGGGVHVRLERTDPYVRLVVSDTGIGITPEFLPYAFDRFRQADSGTTREKMGLGLGLSIAKHIVELHGGTIAVSSGGADAGTTFTVALPLISANAASLDRERAHPRHRPAQQVAVGGDLIGTRVMAVDDDPDSLQLLKTTLESVGATVVAARSSPEALQAMATGAFDVLVSDLGMGGMDGFDLIEQVRQSPREELRRLPSAALTAYARSEDRRRALDSGFDLYLAKPIDPGELVAAVLALTERIEAPTQPVTE